MTYRSIVFLYVGYLFLFCIVPAYAMKTTKKQEFVTEKKIVGKKEPCMCDHVNAQDDDNKSTPLMRVCARGDIAIARALIKAGADVNMQDCWGDTALGYALNAACYEQTHDDAVALIKELIEADADVNIADNDGETVLVQAVKKKQVDIVNILVNKGKAQVNVCDKDGELLLHVAVKSKNVEIVKTLLDACATQKDRALLIAANLDTDLDTNLSKIKAIIILLLDAGASIDARNQRGETPLMLACRRNNEDVVKILINSGASVCVVDNHGNRIPSSVADLKYT
jgi:ankyrin repeat protein